MSDLKSALKKLADETVSPQRIEVDGIDLEMFACAMTIADVERITEQSKNGDTMDEGIYTIIRKVVDAQGNPVFDVGDKMMLKEWPANMIVPIIAQINQLGQFGDKSEAEKD